MIICSVENKNSCVLRISYIQSQVTAEHENQPKKIKINKFILFSEGTVTNPAFWLVEKCLELNVALYNLYAIAQIVCFPHKIIGTLSKPQRQRQRKRGKTKGLMSRTMALHVHNITLVYFSAVLC